MIHLALARKWRPRTFSQLKGQDHVVDALTRSLTLQRLHHAYLFTGTRGVGKTSVARLFAKALNCISGVSAEPCLTCESCLAIEQGHCIDLIEIDGASNTRVEDTRSLLDNVLYAPTQARFKVYIIDEVHMLSNHSFNALLKTLEEPPAHVKFLLATTDPQKLPLTVLSRCLQFHLRPVQPAIMQPYLANVLTTEGFTFDETALHLLINAARGSLRDALSLLDQSLARCDTHLSTSMVASMLGHSQHDHALLLLQALAAKNPDAMLQQTQQLAEEGGNVHHVLNEMLTYLHQMALLQTLPSPPAWLTLSPEVQALSQHIAPEEVQLLYQIALNATQDLSLAPTLAIGFEMTLLRMHTFRPLQLPPAPPAIPRHEPMLASENIAATPEIESTASNLTTVTLTTQQTSSSPALDTTLLPWHELLPKLHLTGMAQSAAENAEYLEKNNQTVVFRIEKSHQSLYTPSVIKRIEEALSQYHQEPIRLTLKNDDPVQTTPAQQKKRTQAQEHDTAHAALLSDPFFQQLQQTFSGEIVKNSVDVLKNNL